MNRSNIEDIFPLTPLQEGMLFHCLAAPEASLYWSQLTLLAHGPLNSACLQRAWRELIARYPSLRTIFAWEKQERPLQVVLRDVDLDWRELDWSDTPADHYHERLAGYLEQDRSRPCDFRRGPLLRFALIRLAADRHCFVWSNHHILIDGWSLGLLLQEAWSIYERLVVGETPENKRTPSIRVYLDWLAEQSWVGAEKFFREHLAGVAAPTPLTTDRAPGNSSAAGMSFGKESVTISATDMKRLETFARTNKLTLSALTQAAWGLLLHRYSGETSVMFGVTVSGRTAPIAGIEQIAGMFINTVPVRHTIDATQRVGSWLQEVQALQANLQQYQHAPLTRIQEWSAVPRGQPMFESIVVFENYPMQMQSAQRPGAVRIESIEVSERPHFPLMLTLAGQQELSVGLTYDAGRFTGQAVRQMLGHYVHLLMGIVADPQRVLGLVPLMSDAEKLELLDRANGTKRDFPRDLCVHQLVQAQAARRPDATAIIFGDAALSYRELDERSNRLARALRRLGVSPGRLVGIFLDRSLDAIVALLGVLKAGGAYVPIDPTYPKERVAFMLSDADPAVLLTQTQLRDRLPPHRAAMLCLDADGSEISREDSSALEVEGSPENLAYVIYTSGSTGRPKGVEIPHRAVVNFLCSMQREPGLTESDVLLAVTTLSFDIAVLELFLPLATGAQVILAPTVAASDPAALLGLLEQHRITVMQATPMTWRLLIAAGWRGRKGLRGLCGGEALPSDLARELLARCGEVWNLYGPTETTVWSTCGRVVDADHVSLGKPIANTEIYVLDQRAEPVPTGIAGELYIGGEGLARGYHHRPELTAEKFIESPFRSGARLYRTGDRARFRADGTLDYLGRLDAQLKVHGFRIEPGEIEAALREHPQVKQAAVVARPGKSGDNSLLAFFVARDVAVPTAGELREHLGSRLPEYMLPSVFAPLPQLPLTPNGKVDRNALRNFDGPTVVAARVYVAPRGPTEEKLAGLWQEVLALERVGVHDNFFEIGGHSLRAIQLVTRIEDAFQVRLPLHLILDAPTVAELSVHIENLRWAGQAAEPPDAHAGLALTEEVF